MSSQTSTFVDLQAAEEDRRSAAWPTSAIERAVERVERAVAAHPLRSDLAVAAAVAGAGVLGLLSQDRLHFAQVAFTAALSLPLLLRRRQPLLVFGLLALIAILQWLIADPQLGDAALLIALYEVALRGGLLELALAGGVIEAGAVIAAVKWAPSDPVQVWIGLSGLGVAAGVLGITVRQRRALLASLHERAARLEFERDQEGRLAAAAERNRIAREMHDIVAHNLSVMIALADGASYAIEATPGEAIQATDQIATTGRDALLEMRRLLGILGDEGSSPSSAAQPLAPQPRLTELERLAERVRAAGVPVQLSVLGELRALPEGVQLAVFRVAQEALTNTLKHTARPTSVCMDLRCGGEVVELDVTDEGPPALSDAGGGRGLRGMRERALAYGGELHAGPLPEGGWRVQLRLPLSAGASGHPDRLAS
ncbi:MAG TPA: histidine kinase [Solirubrobacteraceae bacterium]